MKAIIIAAGRGRRLGPETAEIPKCMVSVGGKPILHRQLDAMAAAGATDFVVVRGYLGDRITAPGYPLRFIENPDWATNNVLASLLFAEPEMDDGFLFSYSDIVFAPAHARLAAASTADVGLIIDRLWQETYVGRVHHPISEAELASVKQIPGGSTVDRVGKTVVPANEANGEFTGLAKFSPAGAASLRRVWARARAAGMETPFGRAAHLRQAYLSDALNAMADDGTRLAPLFIDGRWREIDTEEDLSRAHAVVNSWRD
ncbi:MAG TPA: phosphocholine cytidylyltransferase family protein [Polyangia bacterium]